MLSISVITVCRNSESTIADTIRSVRNQNYPNLEYVIVDGVSTDATLDVIHRETVDFPHRLQIISEPDMGIYDAMAKGISRATGDVVGILNADDYFESYDAISLVAGAFDEITECVLSDIVIVNRNDEQKIVRYYSAARFMPDDLLTGVMPPHAGFYARRSLFAQLGSYDSGYRYAGDFELLVRFFLLYPLRFKYIPVTLVRMRAGGVSNRSLIHRFRLNREVLRALRVHGYPASWLALATKVPGKLMQFFRRPRN